MLKIIFTLWPLPRHSRYTAQYVTILRELFDGHNRSPLFRAFRLDMLLSSMLPLIRHAKVEGRLSRVSRQPIGHQRVLPLGLSKQAPSRRPIADAGTSKLRPLK